jgi:tellurite resistance protein
LYNAAIAGADGFFDSKEYENARTGYRSALNIKPEESYPQQRIDEIATLLAQLSAAQKAYEGAIAKADGEYRREEFGAAKVSYNSAKRAKPDETYPY